MEIWPYLSYYGALGLFFGGNALLIWWHSLYVAATIDPLSHQSMATSTASMQTQFAGICILGALFTLVNGVAAFGVASVLAHFTQFSWAKGTNSRRYFRNFIMTNVVLGLLLGTLIQFLAPFFVTTKMWEKRYRHTCDGMDIRVSLDYRQGSISHSLRGINLVSLSSGDSYTMIMIPNPDPRRFDKNGMYDLRFMYPDTPEKPRKKPPFTPAWSTIRYNLGRQEFEALDINNTPILKGGFGLGKNFSIPALGIHGDLDAFAKNCVFDPTAEIYFDHKVEGGQVKRKLVMKTAQFKICGPLQVCADGGLGEMTAIPLGLLMLQRAGRSMGCCRNPYLPGVEGRG